MLSVRRMLRLKMVPPLLFLVLAMISTWPLSGSLHTHLPLGMESSATVPLFNLWSVWWNADRAAAGFNNYWDAPIFYPTEKSFAFSEPMPLSVAVAPIIWITGNRILAYNCLLLFFLWLNGQIGFCLLRRLGYSRWISLIGGFMLEMLPLIHSFLGVLQLLPIFGILSAFWGLYGLNRRPSLLTGGLLGGGVAVTYLLCAYYGLFLILLLVLCGGFLIWRQFSNLKSWAAMGIGVLICAVTCLPVIDTQHQALYANRADLPESYLTQLSAGIDNYRVPPWPSRFNFGPLGVEPDAVAFKLGPGEIKLLLMLFGIGFGITRRARQDWTLFCLSLLFFSVLLSMGPRLRLFEWHPYLTLIEWMPGLGQVRNIFRFAVFVQIAIVLLAIQGIRSGELAIRRYVRARQRRIAAVALLVASIVAFIEIWPPDQPLYAAPSYTKNQGWIQYLRTRTSAQSVVGCVPFPFKPDVASYQQEAEWLYWGTFHHRRMINGFSGIFPQSFINLKWPMAEFPTPEVITLLKKLDVGYCVVRRDTFYGEDMRSYYRFDPRLEIVFSDDSAQIDIYRLI